MRRGSTPQLAAFIALEKISMKVVSTGYFTKMRKMENRVVSLVREKAVPILGKHAGKIKKINIIFCKHQVNWGDGFSWLVQSDQAIIYIPGNYRSYWRAQWLAVHELCHIKQILEGRLEIRHILNNDGPERDCDYIWYRKRNGRQLRAHTFEHDSWWEYRNNKWWKVGMDPPFEADARMTASKHFSECRTNMAWNR